MEAVVFFVSAAVILGGAIGVIVFRNPVHAALSLVATLFGVAVQLINLEAYFLAAVQVIVYAGAIVVLFLFVIMLLGVDRAEQVGAEPIIGQREFALLAGAGLIALAVLVGVAVGGDVTGVPPNNVPPVGGGLAIVDTDAGVPGGSGPTPTENVREIGRALFSTRFVFAFEITGLLLTIAVVGAVVLARRPKGELQEIPELEPSWALRPESTRLQGVADAEADSDDDAAEVDGESGSEEAAELDDTAEPA